MTVEYRWAAGQLGRLPEMAADLIQRIIAYRACSRRRERTGPRTSTYDTFGQRGEPELNTMMDRKEFESLVRERDTHIEKLIQAKRDLARLKKLRARTHQQELELQAMQKIVADEPVQIAMLDERLVATLD